MIRLVHGSVNLHVVGTAFTASVLFFADDAVTDDAATDDVVADDAATDPLCMSCVSIMDTKKS